MTSSISEERSISSSSKWVTSQFSLKGDIPFAHDRSLEESCIQEVGICDILILIVGGRYGSLAQQEKDAGPRGKSTEGGVGKIKSVTRKEYEKARERESDSDIHIRENGSIKRI